MYRQLENLHIYGVGILTTRTAFINNKRQQLEQFECQSFLNLPAANSDTLLTALMSPPERLGEVRRHGISRTPSPRFS
jgi:hypothetical protein